MSADPPEPSPRTRRLVLATGTKLAYSIPLLAATARFWEGGALASDYCEGCIGDELSPKPLAGGCYTCKAVESGCVNTRSNAQAAAPPTQAGDPVCVCQGNPASRGAGKCIINGREYKPGQIIDDGVCHPVNVAGDPAYDSCVASVSPR